VVVDTDAVLRLIEEVAAEVVTPRFRALTEGQVHEKKPGDLVTVADHEAEVLLT
jgi:fructose-1,6-bisphosphatase/inositol monophosphatase family enzyme